MPSTGKPSRRCRRWQPLAVALVRWSGEASMAAQRGSRNLVLCAVLEVGEVSPAMEHPARTVDGCKLETGCSAFHSWAAVRAQR
mmetsp:Transcript_67215/g.196520  ORF Transcript_67215/g.196520 Transcript_67215/m.196520 type:complete len:84 (+) Transcript_67215:1008-1259(+)